MGNSDKGVIGLLIGGILYAIIKLGDVFILISDEILRILSESFFLRISLDNIWREVAELELSIGTIVLGLLALFLVLAIVDYISTEI
ncbi:hypothetical protein DJ71_17270 [Halorubrum sp. E3]|nr:hypothetical protein DJ71_17270 [Halorubrum sp. E3]